MADYTFSAKDNGASVEVQRGANIVIELNENPTTGYRWAITNIDEASLQPTGDEFVAPNDATPGAGGLRRFFFRTKRAGSTALTLINKRAWQSDDRAADTYSLAIRIVN